MRIAIDCREMLNPSGGAFAGVSHYVHGIVKALLRANSGHEFVLFFRSDTPSVVIEALEREGRFEWRRLPSRRGSLFVSHLLVPALIRAARPDVLFAPAGQLPLGWRGPSVVTVHDLSIYRHPEWFPDRGLGRLFSMRVVVPTTIKKARVILAVSEATKRDLVDLLHVPATKIQVIPEAVEPPAVIPPREETVASFLMVGTIEPRKNHVLVIRAFDELLRRTGARAELRIIGKRGWKYDTVIDEIDLVNRHWAGQGRSAVIRELGYVEPGEKWSELASAQALLHPSLDEGFGLPILEAMSVGTPVVTTQRGAQPELAGDAAVYVEPENVEDLATAMERLLFEDERKRLGALGRDRAKNFSWDRTAGETLVALTCE